MVEVIEMVAADEAGAEQPWLDVALGLDIFGTARGSLVKNIVLTRRISSIDD